MAKLVLAVAGVLFLVAMATVAEASTRTVFTTTTFDDDTNPMGKQMGGYCGQKMADQQMLNHCQMYLMTSTAGKSRGPRGMMDPAQEHLPLCCMQLENMGEECMCEGVKMMMNQQGWTQQDMGQLMNMAMNLPKTCKLTNQQCQMRAMWF